MSRDPRTPVVSLLVIGTEVLSGEVADENIVFIARALFEWGARLEYCHVIRDNLDLVAAEVRAGLEQADWVVTTGGIGVTPDDVTRPAVAKALGLPLERHGEAETIVRNFYRSRINPTRLTLADLPRGASLIYNPVNHIPTFRVGRVIVLPGVPALVHAMFPSQREFLSGAPWHVERMETRAGESLLAASLAQAEERFPGLAIGSYPHIEERPPRVELVVRGKDAGEVQAAAAWLRGEVRRIEGTL